MTGSDHARGGAADTTPGGPAPARAETSTAPEAQAAANSEAHADEAGTFAEWCVLELMGHRRLAGYVTEQEIAGAAFLRIDVPGADDQPPATQWYRPGAVYAITPTTEAIARSVARCSRPEPVHRWELPAGEPDAWEEEPL